MASAEVTPDSAQRLAHGSVDWIGDVAVLEFQAETGQKREDQLRVTDHAQAIRELLTWLNSQSFGQAGLDAVGHRVVHGGGRFIKPTRITVDVLQGIEAVTELAPLHNGPALRAIQAAKRLLGDAVPMVASFDTAFHQSMPERSATYAIPLDLAEKHQVRRYGFHGLAHRSMTERYAALTNRPMQQVKLITLQLGNGCSAAAIDGGHSIDTSMGFTPLEGLMMGTRSGDVDPSLVSFLSRREGVSGDEITDWLNTRSGLLGISGHSQDMRDLLQAEAEGNGRAALAIDMFCYRVRKCIGAYLAALGGAEAIVFGGGIGENAPAVRSRICADMAWCGLVLDEERNARTNGNEGRISADAGGIHVYVLPVDEALMIARDTVTCLLEQHA
jgi:acetate kinase